MLTKNDVSIIETLLKKNQILTQTEFANLRTELKGDILMFKDEIVGRIKDLQIEMIVTKGYGDRLEEHDKRITKLKEINEVSTT